VLRLAHMCQATYFAYEWSKQSMPVSKHVTAAFCNPIIPHTCQHIWCNYCS